MFKSPQWFPLFLFLVSDSLYQCALYESMDDSCFSDEAICMAYWITLYSQISYCLSFCVTNICVQWNVNLTYFFNSSFFFTPLLMYTLTLTSRTTIQLVMQIKSSQTTAQVTCTQTALRVHENLCTVLIPLRKNTLNLQSLTQTIMF